MGFLDEFDDFTPKKSGGSFLDEFDDYSVEIPDTLLSSHDTYEPDAPNRGLLGTAGDIGVSLSKGIVGAGEAVVGGLDLVTGGFAGKAMEDYLGYDPKLTKDWMSGGYTEAQRRANQEVDQAEGFLGKAKTAIQNPSTLGHAVVESLPSMLGGAAIGKGLISIAPKISPLVAAAFGEGAITTGSMAESTRQETGDLTFKQAVATIGAGVGTSAFALVGGGLAKKLGLGDIDTMLVSGRGANKAGSFGGVIRRIVEGGITEGAFEEMPQSAQERVWLNAAVGNPLMEGVPEDAAFGGLTGVAMGGGANILSSGGQPKEASALRETADKIDANAATVDEVINADILRTKADTLEGELFQAHQSLTVDDIMSDFADGALDVQEQADTRTRQYRYDQLARSQPVTQSISVLAGQQMLTPTQREAEVLGRDREKRAEAERMESERISGKQAELEQAFSDLTPENLRNPIAEMEKQLATGETGIRFQKDDGTWDGVKSSNPDFLKQPALAKYDEINGTKLAKRLNKGSFAGVMRKVRAGEELTSAQDEIWEYIQHVARNDKSPEVSAANEYNRIEQEEGIELESPRKVVIADLNEGDKVVVHKNGVPDVVTVKGRDEDGSVVLEDGTRFALDDFDKLEISGIKRAELDVPFKDLPNIKTDLGQSPPATDKENLSVQDNAADSKPDAGKEIILTSDQARSMLSGKTEKPNGVDPGKSFIEDGQKYRLKDVPLDSFDFGEEGAYTDGRYDGTVDMDRAKEYAKRPIETPIRANRTKSGQWVVVDGGHRITAAKLRGDKTIQVIERIRPEREKQSLPADSIPGPTKGDEKSSPDAIKASPSQSDESGASSDKGASVEGGRTAKGGMAEPEIAPTSAPPVNQQSTTESASAAQVEPKQAGTPALESTKFSIAPHGKNIIVKGDPTAIRAKLAASGVTAKGLVNKKEGGVVFPAKLEGEIRGAVDDPVQRDTDTVGTLEEAGESLVKFSQSRGASIEEAKRQYEAAVAEYGADAWQKAKDAGKTKLTERQFYQVRTDSFREWFGPWDTDPDNASKVVDENGEPLVVYHGTPQPGFESFDKEKRFSGPITGHPIAKYGEFFTPDAGYTQIYSGENGGAYPVFLNIRRPQNLSMFVQDFSGPNGMAVDEKVQPYINKAKKKKVDGLFVYMGDTLKEYMTFAPNQIKSAIGNTGQFSPTDYRINYSQSPTTGQPLPSLRSALLSSEYGARVEKLIEQGRLKLLTSSDKRPATAIAGKVVGGYYDPSTDVIYLAADGIAPGTEANTLYHEAFHRQEQMGEVQPFLDELLALDERIKKGPVADWFTKARESAQVAKGTDAYASELGAYAVQQYNEAPGVIRRWVDRLIAKVQVWLRQSLGMKVGKLTPAMLREIAVQGLMAGTVKDSLTVESESAPVYSQSEIMKYAKAFYSKLQQVASDKFQGMKAQSVLPFLQKQGVKREEIEATGVKEWLAGKKPTDKVTQQELSDFVQANTVELEDVVLGENSAPVHDFEFQEFDIEGTTIEYDNEERNASIRKYSRMEPNGEWKAFEDIIEIEDDNRDGFKWLVGVEEYNSLEDAEQEVERIGRREYEYELKNNPPETDTHFSQYTEPGAVEGSYREMFVTAPKSAKATTAQEHFGYADEDWAELRPGYREQLINEVKKYPDTWQDGHSQYSDVKNPVVRVRFNSRTDAQGRKILYIEEIQGPNPSNQQKMPAYLRDNLYNLGVKRILAYAKENGFDGVSWTPGRVQADRYSLEKQVSSIDYHKDTVTKDGWWLYINDPQGAEVLNKLVKTDELEETVGKEVAKKIIDGAGTALPNRNKRLSGLDLRIGGTGLKTLYDSTLPKMFEAYAKGKVGETQISTGERDPNPWKLRDVTDDGDGGIEAEFAIKQAAEEWAEEHGGVKLSFEPGGNISSPFIPLASAPESYPLFSQAPTEEVRYSVFDFEPNSADAYSENRKVALNGKAEAIRSVKSIGSQIAAGLDKYMGAISTRLLKINPKLEAKIRWLDYDIGTGHTEDVKAVEGLLNKAKKMSRADFADWDYARKNSDSDKINELVEKYGMREEYEAYRKTLDKIREDALSVGLDVDYIKDYAPRILKDSKGFLEALGRGPDWDIISRKLRARAKTMGIEVVDMTDEMKADMISSILVGGGNFGVSGPGNIKERKIEHIPPELNRFYMNSDAALVSYLHKMRKAIEARRFFGKMPEKIATAKKNMHAAQARIRDLEKSDNPDTEKIESLQENISAYQEIINRYKIQSDYSENISQYVLELLSENEITPADENTLVDILQARFHERGARGLVQAYKNFSYADTMGSPISAITQIGDLAWAVYENGLARALKGAYRSVTKQSRITKEDVGIERIAQEFSDTDTLSNVVAKTFKLVGLEKMDAIGKEALLNSSLEKYEDRAKSEPEKLAKEIKHMFGSETDSVIFDLQKKEISGNVKFLVYSKLLDYQPAAPSEMSEQYLKAGNGRLFYMLKSYTLKQFDVFRRESYDKIKTGDPKEVATGIRNMIYLSTILILANAGADELKDWVLGRETSFEDRTVDNVLRLFGISKYATWKARTEGVGMASLKLILPPVKFVDSVSRDIITAGDDKGLYSTSSIPLVGKLAYWHLGRGKKSDVELWNHRLSKERNRLENIEEKVESDTGLRPKYRAELIRLKRMGKLQGRLNKKRHRINKLEDLQKKTGNDYSERIKALEDARTEMIKRFLE